MLIGNLDNPPVVIVTKRWTSPLRALWAFATPLPMGCLGAWMMNIALTERHTRNDADLWPLGILLCLGSFYGAVLLTWTIVAPPRMILSAHGIIFRYLWLVRHWPWDTTSGFRKVRYRGSNWVGYDLANPPANNPMRQQTGADGVFLKDTFVDDIDELVALLSEARAKWKAENASDSVKTEAPTEPRRGLVQRLLFGRIGPFAYWACLLAALVMIYAVMQISAIIDDRYVIDVLALSAAVPVLLAAYAIAARMRDLGLNSWKVQLGLLAPIGVGVGVAMHLHASSEWVIGVPLALIGAALIALGFAPGQPAVNRFGGIP